MVALQPLLFCALLFLCIQGNAKTWEICPTCPNTSIKATLGKVMDYDSLLIRSGIYREHEIAIEKPIYIIGENGAVIDGENVGNIIVVRSDSVVIEHLTIRNAGSSFTKDFAAIKMEQTKFCRISDNILENVFFGIIVERSSNIELADNRISSHATEEYNSGNGIHLWYCRKMNIEGNTTVNLRDGIYLEFVDSSKISNNISKENLRYGLHFMFSNVNEYSHNLFENNGAGVAVMFSKNIDMIHNTFKLNWGVASYGLLLKEIYDAVIHHNVFYENSIGINVEGANRIDYYANEFNRNGWAVKIHGGCYENEFHHNNFVSNTFDVSYNGKLNDNSFDNNYWSSYTGYDLNKDGYGDVPFRPVKLYSYVVNKTPETIILLRSLFIDLINISEKVSPVFTPDDLKDNQPLLKPYHDQS